MGYTVPTTPPTDDANKKLYDCSVKARNDILCGLTKSVYIKVMHYKSVKEVWDKLKNIYEGEKRSRSQAPYLPRKI